MAAVAKNKQALLGLKVPEGKDRIQVSIQGEPGLALKVFLSGERRWSFRHKVKDGDGYRQQSHQLGSFPSVSIADACREASNLREGIRSGEIARRRPETGTVGTLADDWWKRHVESNLTENTQRSYRNPLDIHILPTLGDIRVDALRKSDILAVTDPLIAAKKGRAASYTVAILSGMYGWLNTRLDDPIANPTVGIKLDKVTTGTGTGKRALKDHELKAFWYRLQEMSFGEQIKVSLRLLLLTGQRTSAVCGAEVNEFDLDAAQPIWIIRPRTGAKSKQSHELPLPPMAARLWRKAIDEHGDDTHVFPVKGDAKSSHLNRHTLTNACAKYRAKFKVEAPAPHGLRKTVRTKMAELRIPSDWSRRVLNHSDGRSTDVHALYDEHSYTAEKLEALQRWEVELTRLLEN